MKGCCNDMKMINSNTPQGGLGQLDIVEGIFSFATGLFSKDPQKVDYDRIRQQVWDSIVNLVSEHENAKNSGTLSRTLVQHLVDAMSQLLDGFKKYTDGMLAKYPGDADWINPRFHDYYDFGMGIKTAWQQELSTLPADYIGGAVDFIQDLFGGGSTTTTPPVQFPNTTPIYPTGAPTQQAGFSGTSMLLIGGVVLGVILLSKKRGG